MFLKQENLDSAESKFRQSLNLSPGRLSIIHNLISIYIKTQQNDKLNLLLEKNENLSKEKEILYGKAFSFYFEKKESKRNLLSDYYVEAKIYLE